MYDTMYKILLVGDSCVGKSAYLLRFAENRFAGTYVTTIGLDFKIKTINIGDTSYRLQVWDTAGQERFRTITKSLYRNTNGVVIMYDVTDQTSFKNIPSWVNEIKNNTSDDIAVIIVGNKCEHKKRTVSYLEGQQIADKLGARFLECSAKNDINIQDVMIEMVESIDKHEHLSTPLLTPPLKPTFNTPCCNN